MTPAAAADRWAKTWKKAWESFDVEAIVALYAENTVLSTEPFRQPYRCRDGARTYVTQVFAEEEDPWWASLREEGADTSVAGTSILRFDSDGLVVDYWDAWNLLGDRRPPPDHSGPFGQSIARDELRTFGRS